MTYEYYISMITDNGFFSAFYKLNYKIDSKENIFKLQELIKTDGYKNPVILFFKQLNA